MGEVERRYTPVPVESREADGRKKIAGYAAAFNRSSKNLGGFTEVVQEGAFNQSRGDGWPEVIARYNHDDNMLLGTTGARTLELRIDAYGLAYEVEPPQSRADILELVERGDIRKSSFAFRAVEDDWGLDDTGFPRRSLISVQLIDVAPVNVPAYEATSAGLRSLTQVEVALRSLAEKMSADVEEVRSLARENDLRKFFARTDGNGVPKPPAKKLFGPAAAAQLLARREDPWT